MKRTLTVLGLIALFVSFVFADDKGKDEASRAASAPGGKKEKDKDEFAAARTGRAGELSEEEEDRLDKIVERFIEFDIGRNRDPKALKDFIALGPEAIPALIRGFNKAAKMSHSCPCTMLAKKLKQLIQQCEDSEVLTFIRENAGAGIGRTPYDHLVRDLRVTCMLRQRQVAEANRAAGQRQQQNSTGGKGPEPSK